MLASVTSCVNIREFLKDTMTTENHENIAWKREFPFLQFLSWLFQRAYFVKCKQTLLQLNFYQPYPSSWREWILSLLVYVLHKTWLIRHFHRWSCSWQNRNVQKRVMHAQSCFLPYQAIAYLTFSSPPHLKLPIIYDILWWVKNRIFSAQIELLLLIASQMFFRR